MSKRLFVAVVIVSLAAWATAAVAASGSSKGRYASTASMSNTTELPDGTMVQTEHSKMLTFAENPDHPADNSRADCIGVTRIDAGGKVLSATGTCFAYDDTGSGFSWWWRMDEAGTKDCPAMCGSWGYFSGYGKFAGLSGAGTWKETARFPDGGTGTWKGSYSLP